MTDGGRTLRIDRAVPDLLDRATGGRGREWLLREIAVAEGRGERGTDRLRIRADGIVHVTLDIVGRRDVRTWRGDMGADWRWSDHRLWTETGMEALPRAILSTLVGRRLGELVDFEPLAERRVLEILGQSQPYGVTFETDLVDVEEW